MDFQNLYPERPLLNIDYLSSFTEGAFLRFKEYTDELVYGTPRGEHITDLAERLSMPEPTQYPVRLDLKIGVPVQFSDDTMKSKSMMVIKFNINKSEWSMERKGFDVYHLLKPVIKKLKQENLIPTFIMSGGEECYLGFVFNKEVYFNSPKTKKMFIGAESHLLKKVRGVFSEYKFKMDVKNEKGTVARALRQITVSTSDYIPAENSICKTTPLPITFKEKNNVFYSCSELYDLVKTQKSNANQIERLRLVKRNFKKRMNCPVFAEYFSCIKNTKFPHVSANRLSNNNDIFSYYQTLEADERPILAELFKVFAWLYLDYSKNISYMPDYQIVRKLISLQSKYFRNEDGITVAPDYLTLFQMNKVFQDAQKWYETCPKLTNEFLCEKLGLKNISQDIYLLHPKEEITIKAFNRFNSRIEKADKLKRSFRVMALKKIAHLSDNQIKRLVGVARGSKMEVLMKDALQFIEEQRKVSQTNFSGASNLIANKQTSAAFKQDNLNVQSDATEEQLHSIEMNPNMWFSFFVKMNTNVP